MRFDDFHLKLTSFIQDRVCFGRGGGGGGGGGGLHGKKIFLMPEILVKSTEENGDD